MGTYTRYINYKCMYMCMCVCVCTCVCMCEKRDRELEKLALGKMGGMEVKDGDEVVGNGREKQVAGSVGYKDKKSIWYNILSSQCHTAKMCPV